jgi:hypothetical protein
MHGLGVAGGLSEAGLPQGHIPTVARTLVGPPVRAVTRRHLLVMGALLTPTVGLVTSRVRFHPASGARRPAPQARDAPDGERGVQGNGRPYENADKPAAASVCENGDGRAVVKQQRRD